MISTRKIDQAIQNADKYRREGHIKRAEHICKQVLKIAPDNAVALYLMGLIAYQTGKNLVAIEFIRKAISRNPGEPGFHHDLGSILVYEGHLDEAIPCYETALALNPEFPMAHHSLGVVLRDKGRPLDAIAHYKIELNANPRHIQTYNDMGLAFQSIGEADTAIEYYKKALSMDPGFAMAHQNLLLAMHYSAKHSGEQILEESRRYSERYPMPTEHDVATGSNRSKDRINIGYVSADLNNHPVANFIMPVLEHHNNADFEIFAYYNFHQDHDITNRIKRHCKHWRNISGMSDAEAAKKIRSDKIDILVDLSGHTKNNRLAMFALKPAPVQVTWLGYPGTTGLSCMDYRITDSFADPVGETDHCYTEKLIRLPESFSCYSTLISTPEVGSLPALTNGHITFGSFNNLAKITPEVLSLWADILGQIPGSRMVLKYRGLDDSSMQAMLRDRFLEHGIESQRLTLLGRDISKEKHLDYYNRIDIALDTFPYCGTTTTCDALWMGVPVITLAGHSHAARVGVSQLSNVGMDDLIASDKTAYTDIAKSLAHDLARLQQIRFNLRDIMQSSPLMDAARFTRNLEAAFNEIHHRRIMSRETVSRSQD